MSGTFPSSPAPRDVAISSNQNTIVTTTASGRRQARQIDGQTELATQMIPVDNHEVLFDTGEVKIVLNTNQEALYFSRMVIPFIKGVNQTEWHLHHPYYRHVGMYAYRTDILQKITALSPSSLENAESLEQLRWIQNGFKIKLVQTKFDSHCIDTPEDIEKVLKLMGIQA